METARFNEVNKIEKMVKHINAMKLSQCGKIPYNKLTHLEFFICNSLINM